MDTLNPTAFTTPLSRRPPSPPAGTPTKPLDPPASRVARASLCFLFAMSLPSCLVTSSPTFEEPERTPPFLMGPTARPDSRQIKVINVSGTQKIEFSVEVRSEDNSQSIAARLVLDYGVSPPGIPEQPYKDLIQADSFDPGTLSDSARTLSFDSSWSSGATVLGCHNVSLLATHNADKYGCAVDPGDFDFMMWTVLVCDGASAPCCDPEAPLEAGGCSQFQCPPVDENNFCGANIGPTSFQGGSAEAESGGAP